MKYPDEMDFEKRVKECLKLSRGKQMGAGDAPHLDVDHCRNLHNKATCEPVTTDGWWGRSSPPRPHLALEMEGQDTT